MRTANMPAGQGEDAERFAAALEQGTPPGFADDDLARELEIVAMLRSAGPAYAPDPDPKARARQRLMAVVAEQGELHRAPARPVPPPSATEMTAPIGRVEPSFPTPRGEADGVTTAKLPPLGEEQTEGRPSGGGPRTLSPSVGAPRTGRRSRHSVANRPEGRARTARRPAPSLRRRVLVVGAAALVVMLGLTGGGFVASRDALPGDNLYALKRAGESAELAFTFDEAARAQRHLQFAANRLTEVEQMVARGEQTADPAAFSTAISEFDTSTGEGSRLLLGAAEDTGQTAELDTLHSWAAQQSERLTELRPALPEPAAVTADGSIQLLDLLLGRTESLGASPDVPNRLGDQEEDQGTSEPDVTDTPTTPDATESTPPSGSEDSSEPTTERRSRTTRSSSCRTCSPTAPARRTAATAPPPRRTATRTARAPPPAASRTRRPATPPRGSTCPYRCSRRSRCRRCCRGSRRSRSADPTGEIDPRGRRGTSPPRRPSASPDGTRPL
ncbi:hypothetical protein BJF78_03385 [Pseudonocardia sp. CNS-139]|nr:hypothetical protein BJF78_03385 [Pseudonocardia sp. CNS-139]